MFSIVLFFVFKQKTAYEMRISDWSSDVCSSDLGGIHRQAHCLYADIYRGFRRDDAVQYGLAIFMLANLKIGRVGSRFDEISGAVDEEQAWLSALEFSGNQYGRISRCPMRLYGLAVSLLHGVHRLTDDLRRTEHRVTIQ